MGSLQYIKLLSEEDSAIPQLLQIYRMPDISRYLSISDHYFHYVANTKNVYYYKVYETGNLIGTIHLEKQDTVLFMDILVFPEFQNLGLGTEIIKDIKNDIFNLNYDTIEISIDERNTASIKLFENSGFTFVSKECELMNYIYKK